MIMNRESTPPAMVKLQGTIQAVSRMNFYLWMYIAQEGEFDEAMEFVRTMQLEPSPFEEMLGINPWEVAAGYTPSLDDL